MAFGSAGRSTTFAFVAEDKFSKTADHVGKKAGGMGSKLKMAGKGLAIGAGAAAAGVGLLAVGGLKAVKVAEEQATASARLSKVLDSMGYGKNAAAADKYADSIEQVIAVDSAEIKAGQAKLATFGDIAKSQKLMQRSTMLTADMAAAGFGSIGSNAVGLGKALQDPIAGMSLLSKAGSLTKDEQKAIGDEFLKTGDKAAAQTSILEALEKQVGGTAEATADSSVKMSLGFGEITEEIGGALTPAFDGLVKVGLKVTDWIVKVLIPKAKEFGTRIMPKVREVMDAVRKAFKDNQPQMQKLGDILKGVAGFVTKYVIPAFLKWVKFILPKLVTAVGFVIDAITKITPTVLNVAKLFVKGFGLMFDAVVGLVDNGLKLIAKIPGPWQESMKKASASVTAFRDGAKEKFTNIENTLESAAKKVEDFNSRSKMKADISDLKAKINTAKEELQNPELTKERKAKLKADIHELQRGVKDAKGELASVKDKNVHVTVTVDKIAVTQGVRNKLKNMPTGGMGGEGGPAVSGPRQGFMSATRGKGYPGAKFAQWGKGWSWNKNSAGYGQHDGADISGVGRGTPIYAPNGGHFVRRLYGGPGPNPWHGNAVQWSKNGTTFTYAHMSRFGGTSPGGVIGYVGSTGNSTGPHLHVQARRSSGYVNPAHYLAQGGIVKRRPGGTVIVAGEGRHDEAVVPLDGRGGMGSDVHLHFHNPVIGSKEDLARYVTDAQLDLKRRRGVDLGLT